MNITRHLQMRKADIPARKRKIVTMQSLMGNKGVGGSQPVLCPMEVKYVKVSLNLRNSRDEMSKGAPTRGVLLLQMAHFDDPYPCILAQAGPTSWTGKLKILSFSSNLMAWFKH